MASWRNRIVGLEYHTPDELADHPLQWRTHPRIQREALEGILQEVGIAGALLAYRTDTGLVALDGHLRKSLRQDVQWPVLILDVDEAEARKLLVTHDPIGALAQVDATMLAQLLEDLNIVDGDVQALLDKLAADQGLREFDPLTEWQAMPEYRQDDAFEAVHTIKVHFAVVEDIATFAECIGQTVTDRTRYIWYPKRQELDLLNYISHEP